MVLLKMIPVITGDIMYLKRPSEPPITYSYFNLFLRYFKVFDEKHLNLAHETVFLHK